MSINSIKYNIKLFLIILMVLNLILVMVFLVKNVLTFYILFESTLIPVFIIVLLWGSRLEKLRAAYYLLFFTLSSSLLMLIAIIKVYIISGSLKIDYLYSVNLPMNIQKWGFIGFALAMGVKIPLIPFHI
jgi:NADH:ubiquinone oxidoreductase subunit 4 (subunit M)